MYKADGNLLHLIYEQLSDRAHLPKSTNLRLIYYTCLVSYMHQWSSQQLVTTSSQCIHVYTKQYCGWNRIWHVSEFHLLRTIHTFLCMNLACRFVLMCLIEVFTETLIECYPWQNTILASSFPAITMSSDQIPKLRRINYVQNANESGWTYNLPSISIQRFIECKNRMMFIGRDIASTKTAVLMK